MGYNNGLEQKKFEADWQRLREEYRAAGMSEAAIEEMMAYDRHCMNRDRKYYEHTRRMDFRRTDGTVVENTAGPLRDTFGGRLRVEAQITDPDRRFAWIDELEDEELVKAVKNLSEQDVEVLTMFAFEEKTHEEIAAILGKGRSSITERIGRISKKLKKF